MAEQEGTHRVIIVGGGVIGVCSAYSLAQRGAIVTVIDADELCRAASFGNAGLISHGHLPMQQPGVVRQALKWMVRSDSPLYVAPRIDLPLWAWLWRFWRASTPARLERNMATLSDLSRITYGCFEEIHRESDEAFYFKKRGFFDVYLTERGLSSGLAQAEVTARHGFGHERLGRDDLLDREPAICEQVAGAVWYPDSVSCNPHRFVQASADLAMRLGAEFLENSPVRRITLDGEQVTGVELADGRTLAADTVVLAAGPWTAQLARPLGVRFPLQPAKGYHRDVAMVDPPLQTSCLLGEANMVTGPMGDFLRLAGTLEFSGMNDAIRRNRLEMLSKGASKYLRGFQIDSPSKSDWVGMRPCSPDGLPIIGWAPNVGGLFIATGHAMLGLTQGPATGKIVADCVLQGETSLMDIAPMRVDRFRAGRFKGAAHSATLP